MLFHLLMTAAVAGPFQTLHATPSLPSQQAEMGGGLGYIAPTNSSGAGPIVLSG